ncbi:hypothetical protein BDZ94DRAFT_1142667, partial [Collybia nuda]
ESETNSKFWFQMNKNKAPCDTIAALKKPGSNPPELIRKSSDMAEIARDYHAQLQKEGTLEGIDLEGESNDVLCHLKPEVKTEHKNLLAARITEDEVSKAMKELPSGKSPGMDGITHELWTLLAERYKNSLDQHGKLNIARALTQVFNDIEEFGVVKNTDFSKGW